MEQVKDDGNRPSSLTVVITRKDQRVQIYSVGRVDFSPENDVQRAWLVLYTRESRYADYTTEPLPPGDYAAVYQAGGNEIFRFSGEKP